MKTALVHYWLVNRRGGEKTLDAIASLLPGADLISHVVDPKLLTGPLADRTVRETFISKLPAARRRYALYLELMPLALEMMDMSKYDLIVSSEAGPAKWVIGNPDTPHICYCHSPLRYIWDQKSTYFEKIPKPLRPFAEMAASRLRTSDVMSSFRVTTFVANSNFVAKRIWNYYRREAEVIHPPVDVDQFQVGSPEDFYLLAGELRHYKGAETAVRACAELDRPLVVMGGGDNKELRALCGPKTVFTGRVTDEEFRSTLSRCKALLFPGVEDFGLVPVETMASGRPVIAYGRGGVLDTVKHGETGWLYKDPSVEGLKQAILAFESEQSAFSPTACVEQAQRFRPEAFDRSFASLLPAGASPYQPVAPIGSVVLPRPKAAMSR